MINKFFIFLILALITSCASGGKVVTQESFSEIERGITVTQLKGQLGSPNEIKKLASGDEEYIYFERIQANKEVVELRHYIFIIKQGKVFDKKMRFMKQPLPYRILERNAYDLQTSQNHG